jgi:hypothetical protein
MEKDEILQRLQLFQLHSSGHVKPRIPNYFLHLVHKISVKAPYVLFLNEASVVNGR